MSIKTPSGDQDIAFFDKILTKEKKYNKVIKIDTHWLRSYIILKDRQKQEQAEYGLIDDYQGEETKDEVNPIMFELEKDSSSLLQENAKVKKFAFDDDEEEEVSVVFESEIKQKVPSQGEQFVMFDNDSSTENTDEVPNSKLKPFHRKYGEEIDTEEVKVSMFRRKKLEELGKFASHLYLFSDVDTSNYYELNSESYVKAWSILYYFRNKSLHSPLYDEVENIQARNLSGKRISHKLFNDFYSTMLKVSMERNYHLTFSPRCQNSGWYMDMSVSKGNN